MKIRRRSSRQIASNGITNGGKSLQLSVFDKEPGYYNRIVRPLLVPSHEKELIYWLKNTELIKPIQMCSNKMSDGSCNSPMRFIEAKGLDLFQWKCEECCRRTSIRDDSIFSGLNCNFKNAIRILLAWCKGHHVDYVANMLGVNNSIIEELYIRATSVAEKCMKATIGKWQIGGPGVIVLVDTYPEGCMNSSLSRMNRPILCISEVKSIPQKYWLETLDHYNPHDSRHIESLKQRISRTIQTIVRPGSILITPTTSTLCSFEDLTHLKTLYPTIVSVGYLARHDTEHQNVFSNLETIWRNILDICEEAQFYCSSYVDLFIVSHMWRMMHKNEAFEMLLYQISAQ